MKYFLIVVCIGYSLCAHADYLKVYRDNTWIKDDFRSEADKIYKVDKDQLLILLDEGIQSNGYYHVQYPNSNITGYLYRTMVKRISGDFPVFHNGQGAVEITVIDVGAGMSALIKMPGGEWVIYDAGLNNRAYDYISSKVDLGSEIEYLMLSHTDADHWGSAEEIVREYNVNNVLRTDYRANKRSQTLGRGVTAIADKPPSVRDRNISVSPITPGEMIYDKDGVEMYFMMGFGEIPEIAGWERLSAAKKNNGVSIVVKLVYGEHSILFTGDAVGRNDGKDGCIVSEKFMLDTLSTELLDADVLVAAHHGADNGSCMSFIEAVSPEYVVFPAGHNHHHPNRSTAERFLAYGVPLNHIYRTDLGDYESGGKEPHQQEWNYPPTTSDQDIDGDDHIRIVMPSTGNLQIGYELQVD